MTARKKDPLDEALKLLGRAGDARSRLRALEAVRASLALELKDHGRARTAMKAPSDRQLAKLRSNLADAWAEYEAVAEGGIETSLRALQGVREAIGQLRAADARLGHGDTVVAVLKDHHGTEVTRWETKRELAYKGVPERYQQGHRLVVQMTFSGTPDLKVYNLKSGKLVWRKPSTPEDKPQPRRALPHEEPFGSGNGHGG